jgi:predicted TPR repeat methyltransferase
MDGEKKEGLEVYLRHDMKTYIASKVKRNEPCPCGSGLKHKKCCEGKATPQSAIDQLMQYKLKTASDLCNKNNLKEAEEILLEVLRDNPFNDKALNVLGMTVYKAGNIEKAIFLINKAISNNPDEPLYYYNLASILIDNKLSANYHETALAYLHKAVAIDNNLAQAQYAIGVLYFRKRELEKAKPFFERALELKPKDKKSKYFLAAINGQNVDTAPTEYVAELFNTYADRFEEHLTTTLQYNTPARIAEILADYLTQNKFSKEKISILDLGCGTGLCGQEIRNKNINGKLIGIDISPNMVDKTKEKKIYHEVEVADIKEYLANTTHKFEVISAADVFIYIGKLESVFKHGYSILKKDGILIFSLEKEENGQPYTIRSSARFGHSKAYIEKLTNENNFTIAHFEEVFLRKEGNTDIAGYIFLLKKE